MTAVGGTMGTTVIAIAMIAWLVSGDVALDLVTPTPEKTVQAFVTAVMSGRFDVARERLEGDARARLQGEALRHLRAQLRAAYGEVRVLPAAGAPTAVPTSARYAARLATSRAGRLTRTFELIRDPRSRLWQITAFDL